MGYNYWFASDQHHHDDDTMGFAASAASPVSEEEEQQSMDWGMNIQTLLAVLSRMNSTQRVYTLAVRFVERHKGMLSMTSRCVDAERSSPGAFPKSAEELKGNLSYNFEMAGSGWCTCHSHRVGFRKSVRYTAGLDQRPLDSSYLPKSFVVWELARYVRGNSPWR